MELAHEQAPTGDALLATGAAPPEVAPVGNVLKLLFLKVLPTTMRWKCPLHVTQEAPYASGQRLVVAQTRGDVFWKGSGRTHQPQLGDRGPSYPQAPEALAFNLSATMCILKAESVSLGGRNHEQGVEKSAKSAFRGGGKVGLMPAPVCLTWMPQCCRAVMSGLPHAISM